MAISIDTMEIKDMPHAVFTASSKGREDGGLVKMKDSSAIELNTPFARGRESRGIEKGERGSTSRIWYAPSVANSPKAHPKRQCDVFQAADRHFVSEVGRVV